jgi:uncharacterized protein (TIGR03067 family)
MMWTKVKLLGVALAACLLAIGLTWFALAGRTPASPEPLPKPPQGDKPKTDAELVQGKWKATQVGGKTAVGIVIAIWGDKAAKIEDRPEIVVTTERIIVKAGDQTHLELEYKLNPAAKPKQIDLKVVKHLPPDGKFAAKPLPAGTVIKGIYALEQDKVTIVWTHEKNIPRPTEITNQEGMPYFFQEWQRVKK